MKVSQQKEVPEVAQLTNKLKEVEKTMSIQQSEDAAEIAQLSKTVKDLRSEIDRLKSQAQKSTAPVRKASAPSTSIQWELRAAQPGKAWVAQKGRDQLQPIVVGDVLSGIGRIKSISFDNQQWIVIGEKGQIRQ